MKQFRRLRCYIPDLPIYSRHIESLEKMRKERPYFTFCSFQSQNGPICSSTSQWNKRIGENVEMSNVFVSESCTECSYIDVNYSDYDKNSSDLDSSFDFNSDSSLDD